MARSTARPSALATATSVHLSGFIHDPLGVALRYGAIQGLLTTLRAGVVRAKGHCPGAGAARDVLAATFLRASGSAIMRECCRTLSLSLRLSFQ